MRKRGDCNLSPLKTRRDLFSMSGNDLLVSGLSRPSSGDMALVCERVDDVIDPELVGLIGGVNGIKWIARPLPVIAHIIVVVHDHHQPASTVFQPIKLRRPPAIRRLYIKSFD